MVFFALVRWQPRTWWLWGWGAFTLLSVLLAFVWPVLVAPLFNRFTPLQDRDLSGRIRALAAAADVSLGDVLVADASRRSTAENAYVAGFSQTKRMVLYDTLLRSGTERETLFVVAHELGHEAESHVLKNIALSSAGLLGRFSLLACCRADDVVVADGCIGTVRSTCPAVAGCMRRSSDPSRSRSRARARGPSSRATPSWCPGPRIQKPPCRRFGAWRCRTSPTARPRCRRPYFSHLRRRADRAAPRAGAAAHSRILVRAH